MAQATENVVIPTTYRWVNFGTVPNVGASGVGFGVIPTEMNVHFIDLYLTASAGTVLTRAQMIADIDSIEIKLNGELIVDSTPTYLLDLYKFHFDKFGALSAPEGVLRIPFVRKNLPVWGLNRAFALGMKRSNGQGWNSLSYKVKFTSGLTTLAKAEIIVVGDSYPSEPTGQHIRILQTTRDLTDTGWLRIPDFNVTPQGILAYHILDTNPTRFRVTKGRDQVMGDTPYETLKIMMDEAGRTPQTNWTHLPFDLANNVNGFEWLSGYVQQNAWLIELYAGTAPGAGTVIVSEEVWDGVKE